MLSPFSFAVLLQFSFPLCITIKIVPKGGIFSMAPNNLDDVFKKMRQYQQNNQSAPTASADNADPSTSQAPKVSFVPSNNQIEIPKEAKQSRVQKLLSHLPFMNSPKRNLIYGISGVALAVGLVLAAFHAVVSPTAPNNHGNQPDVAVTQSAGKKHQKSDTKKSDAHKKNKKSDKKSDKKKDKKSDKNQHKDQKKKPEQKKQESKKPALKKQESRQVTQPSRQQAARSTQHRSQPAQQSTQRRSQPAPQRRSQPAQQNRQQPAQSNGGGWSMNNGGSQSNGSNNSGSSNGGTMSDGVYDGWDDDSRVGIYDSDGNLIN